jgi:hypothetical protein
VLKISDVENLDSIPDESDIPHCFMGVNPDYSEKYAQAFEAETQEEADFCFLMMVAQSLRFGETAVRDEKGFVVKRRRMIWREAVAHERLAMAWFALGKDVSRRVMDTTSRDFVRRLYKAELPASVTGKQDEDILERVHRKGEKNAKRSGEVYWRKVQKVGAPPAEMPEVVQESLF